MNCRMPIVVCTAIGLAALTACGTAPTTGPAKAAPVTAGATANMASNCFACHGPNGRSPGSIPSLHNHTAATMALMLKAFKSGAQPSTVMARHAKGYSDAEIDALANYFGNLNKMN